MSPTDTGCWRPGIHRRLDDVHDGAGDDRHEILDMMISGPAAAEYPAADVSRALEALGLDVQPAEVSNHRARTCTCRKDRA